MAFSDEVTADAPLIWWDTRQYVTGTNVQPDRSGNGHTGSAVGLPGRDLDGTLEFNGTQHIRQDTDLTPVDYSTWAIEAVFNLSSVGFFTTFAGFFSDAALNDRLLLTTAQASFSPSDPTFIGEWFNGPTFPLPGGTDRTVPNSPFPATHVPAINTDYHVVFEGDGTNVTIYVNGSVFATVADSLDATFFDTANFTAAGDQYSQNIDGWLRHAIFYDHALGAARVTAHHAVVFSDDPTDFTGGTPPTLISLNPSSGPVDTTVQIFGTLMDSVINVIWDVDGSILYIGPTHVDDGELDIFNAPAHALGTVRIQVYNGDGTSAESLFFTYTEDGGGGGGDTSTSVGSDQRDDSKPGIKKVLPLTTIVPMKVESRAVVASTGARDELGFVHVRPKATGRVHTAADASGNGRTGTYRVSAGATPNSEPVFFDSATVSDDVDTGIALATHTVIDVPAAPANWAGPWSLECWVRSASLAVNGMYGAADSPGPYDSETVKWLTWVNDGTNIFIAYWGPGGDNHQWSSTGWTLSDNAWHHIVLTYSGTGSPITYVDGVADVMSFVTGSAIPTTAMTNAVVGSSAPWNVDNNGVLDEFAIYTHVISPTRVSAHFAAASVSFASYGASVQSDNPIAYYHFHDALPETFNLWTARVTNMDFVELGVHTSQTKRLTDIGRLNNGVYVVFENDADEGSFGIGSNAPFTLPVGWRRFPTSAMATSTFEEFTDVATEVLLNGSFFFAGKMFQVKPKTQVGYMQWFPEGGSGVASFVARGYNGQGGNNVEEVGAFGIPWCWDPDGTHVWATVITFSIPGEGDDTLAPFYWEEYNSNVLATIAGGTLTPRATLSMTALLARAGISPDDDSPFIFPVDMAASSNGNLYVLWASFDAFFATVDGTLAIRYLIDEIDGTTNALSQSFIVDVPFVVTGEDTSNLLNILFAFFASILFGRIAVGGNQLYLTTASPDLLTLSTSIYKIDVQDGTGVDTPAHVFDDGFPCGLGVFTDSHGRAQARDARDPRIHSFGAPRS